MCGVAQTRLSDSYTFSTRKTNEEKTMINANPIKPDMPVVCSEDGQFATVDHMEGANSIKLTKDKFGQHHYIPLSWVVSTADGKVKIDRSGDQAMREWSTTSPLSYANSFRRS
jgi:hypothetical protein